MKWMTILHEYLPILDESLIVYKKLKKNNIIKVSRKTYELFVIDEVNG